MRPKTYAVIHKDDEIRKYSRSGGVFSALTDLILQNNGVVYGCVLDDKFSAYHIRTKSIETRNMMRGSKYIQSEMRDSYASVKSDLENQEMVLFSGTPCQIAGLKSFLGKEYSNLVCVDIVCHGVPSPEVWHSYLQWNERKYGGSCFWVDFRNKDDFGWDDHVETLKIKKGKRINKIDSRVFTTIFYGHCVLRPSCFRCPYKSTDRVGDISLADYWGIEKAAPDFKHDNKGVSLVLVNNEVGEKWFESIKENIVYAETRIEDSLRPSLVAPFDVPKDREQFWRDYRTHSFSVIARKYGGYGIRNKFIRFLKRLKRVCKK